MKIVLDSAIDQNEMLEGGGQERPPSGRKLRLLGYLSPYHHKADVPHAFMLIEFIARSGELKRTLVPATYLDDHKRFKDHLTARHFDWAGEGDVRQVLREFQEADVSSDGRFTVVPGWYDGRYCRGSTFIGDRPDLPLIHFVDDDSVKMNPFFNQGNLGKWRKVVASSAKYSSRIRLVISLPFAAAMMQHVKVMPFGLNFYGISSKGKTLLLTLLASVTGAIGPVGLPNLGSSLRAVEEMRLGNRDGVTILDEVGLIPGDKRRVAEVLKALSFMSGSKRARDRAAAYERINNAPKADCPTIIAMSSEVAIWTLMRDAEVQRLTGESVRLIDQPAFPRGSGDIFGGEKAEQIGVGDDRRDFVENLEAACREHQGVAHVAFLEALLREGLPDATTRAREWMQEFHTEVADLTQTTPVRRIAASYALVYAGARLAIDYGVLPWGAKPTLRDIAVCFRDAVEPLVEDEMDAVVPAVRSADVLAKEFLTRIADADLSRAKEGEDLSEDDVARIEAADGIKRMLSNRKRILLKPDTLLRWFPQSTERSLLVRHLQDARILSRGRDRGTATRQVKIKGLKPARQGYYVFVASKVGRKKH
jgi:hypothetical protein